MGNGLVSLSLAKALVGLEIYVDIISTKKIRNFDKDRTIGLSRSNIEFFNKKILNIEKILWHINKIEILSEKNKNEKILDFENNNKKLFALFKNYQLFNLLSKTLDKNKYLSFKKEFKNKDYSLIINCDQNSKISKKFFFKRFKKNYDSHAYTTIIDHKKIKSNNTAYQTFTKNGPIAYLPVSEKQTSIVYSVKNKNEVDLKKSINKFNPKYEIVKIRNFSKFQLSSSSLRKYYHTNILAFGDLLHKLHPLAGQGFNMSIRDIRELISLVELRISNGLELNNSICEDFEKKTKHKNYIFANSIDFIYEAFDLENKANTNILSKSLQMINKKKNVSKFFIKFADQGIVI